MRTARIGVCCAISAVLACQEGGSGGDGEGDAAARAGSRPTGGTSGAGTNGGANAGGGTTSTGGSSTGGTNARGGAAGAGVSGGTEGDGGEPGTGGAEGGTAGSGVGGVAGNAGSGAVSGAAGSGGGSGGSAGVPWDGTCPSGLGPTMVKFPTHCIDSTEVTRAQYQAWLDTGPNPATARQHETCAANTSFELDAACLAGSMVCQGASCGNYPAVCVDWCDAHAFCYAAGKRLCGAIGGGGYRGSGIREQAARDVSQWFQACAIGVARSGTDYCNTSGRALDRALAVGSLPQCQTTAPGYEGVYDLTANVWERVDECELTDRLRCIMRGGSFNSYYASCTNDAITTNDMAAPHIGFRCCAP